MFARTLLIGLSLGALLAVPTSARADDKAEWLADQTEILVNRAWETAITDGGGGKGSVAMNFYPNGKFKVSLYANGKLVSSTSGKYRLEVHSQQSALLYTTVGGGKESKEYLEILSPQKIGISTFPLANKNRVLFVGR